MEITLKIKEKINAQQASELTKLGSTIEEGLLTECDYETAFKVYTVAARAGDATAFYRIGRMYMNGMGIPKDFKKATLYFKKGAGFGDIASIIAVGKIYESENNINQAAYCFKIASEADDVDGIMYYAHILEKTKGDIEEIMNLYRRAANLGCADAASAVGRIFEDKNNPDVAVFWYRQAVKLGNMSVEPDIKRLEQVTEKDIDIDIEYDDDI